MISSAVGIWAEGSVILWHCLQNVVGKLNTTVGIWAEGSVILWLFQIVYHFSCWAFYVGIWAEGSVILWHRQRSSRTQVFLNCLRSWDLSGRLGYFVTEIIKIPIKIKIRWDLSGRLVYFVTDLIWNWCNCWYMLGFERKARLFCDIAPFSDGITTHAILLGFERKARLFCDLHQLF